MQNLQKKTTSNLSTTRVNKVSRQLKVGPTYLLNEIFKHGYIYAFIL